MIAVQERHQKGELEQMYSLFTKLRIANADARWNGIQSFPVPRQVATTGLLRAIGVVFNTPEKEQEIFFDWS
jgi:hypothetical protein